jgi:hypothetical protein
MMTGMRGKSDTQNAVKLLKTARRRLDSLGRLQSWLAVLLDGG